MAGEKGSWFDRYPKGEDAICFGIYFKRLASYKYSVNIPEADNGLTLQSVLL